jgi:transcriptional regulator with XRE-family HTH domain
MSISVDRKATGENIRRLIKENNLKIEYVQYMCGFNTPQSIYKWINGKNTPTLDNLLILSSIFDCKIDDIIVVERK